ncbi:hypothetical protein VTL71DRAFT_9224 [Oculimacula yallundae]|uniref:Protein kinase domain-containing protein n=1 Tax=Oculimacula yallundae TaxID=86028 RepID=A0ABR4BSF2_9HELO
MSAFDVQEAASFREALTKRLTHRGNHYCFVRVLLLYWQVNAEQDEAYRKEGRLLGDLFDKTFKYDVQEFPIPLENSHLALRNRIDKEVLVASDAASKGNAKALLIVHYGGHGDGDFRQQRSIWASSAVASQGEPMVEWFRIQQNLEDSPADVLLLLDCCFSGTAGRAIGQASRIEVLTASSKTELTPAPGPSSFTSGLIAALSTTVATKGQAVVSEVHRQLLHSSASLRATSVNVVIRPGHPDRSICLRPLDVDDKIVPSIPQGPSFRLLVHTGNLNVCRLEEIVGWLNTDIPADFSLEVEGIVKETRSLKFLVATDKIDDQPLGRVLDLESTQDITASWNKLSRLIDGYVEQHQNPVSRTRRNLKAVETEAHEFLRILDTHNKTLIRQVERGILQSTYVDSDKDDLDSIINMTQLEDLGISNKLRLRQTIKHPQEGSQIADDLKTEVLHGAAVHDATKWTEAKIYGPYMNPIDIPLVEERISFISNLLAAPKSSAFRSLRCSGCHHDEFGTQFVLEFDIPVEFVYKSGGFKVVSLHQVIVDRKLTRPTLGERFNFAAAIARAVEQWHSIGWLHQTINSHNVLFFLPDEEDPAIVDYSRPFLQGLDFARPKLGPSIGRYVDDPDFNVYRHEERQGPSRHGHTQLHDIYSLGVVLLEIGLWESACSTAKLKARHPLEISQMVQNLKAAAATRVAHYAGKEFQEAVCACLTSEFGVERDDSAHSQLAKAFEVMVLNKLELLQMIH